MNPVNDNSSEKKAEDALNSINFIQRANLKEESIQRIIASAKKGEVISIRPSIKWAVAASIAVLICINVVSAVRFNKLTTSNDNPVYRAYFSEFPNF